MHTWPNRKIKARKRTATATETGKTGVRCGKWVLRSTKSRVFRGQHFTPSTPARVAPKQKRNLTSSQTSSQNSCTPSIPNAMEEDYDDLKKWPENHTREFILAMLEEQKRSLGPNTVKKVPFKEKKWNNIVEDVAKRTGTRRYTKRRLKGKHKRMRHLFNKFTDLIRRSGFGWDEELGTVTAPDEAWEDIIQRNPDAAKFRDKGLPHYELLLELYNNSVATGELNRASSRGAPESDDEYDMRMSLSQGQVGASSGSRKRKSQECDSKAAEKTKKNELFEILGNYLDLRTKQLQGEGAQDQQSNEDRYSIPVAMDLLNEFVNYIPPSIYLKASEMFMMSADVRQTWLCLHPAARMGWLMKLG